MYLSQATTYETVTKSDGAKHVRPIYTITTLIRFTLKYRIGIIRIILIPLVQPFGVQHFAFCVVSRWDVRIICIPRIVSIISGITVVIRFCTTIK